MAAGRMNRKQRKELTRQLRSEDPRLAAHWPGSRLLEVWNSLPGQKPVKTFTNRKAAVTRIWAALQSIAPDGGAQAARAAPKKAKSKRASRTEKPATAHDGSKTAQIRELLKRPGGAISGSESDSGGNRLVAA